MKHLNFLWGIGLLTILLSCSSANNSKDITPTSTEFTSGELAKLIEVVDEPCQLSYVEKDGAIATQFIKLKVKLRLRKESPELQNVDAQDIHFTKLLSVATINLIDESETKVQDLSVKSEELLKLKKFLQKEEGAEEIITFEGEFHNSKDAPTWFKETAAFIPYLTGDVIIENESNTYDLNLMGVLGGSNDAIFSYNNSTNEGKVIFTVNGVKNVRKLKMGAYDNTTNVLVMKEYFTNGDYVGDFNGIWKDGVYQGTFTNINGSSVDFVFKGATGYVDFSYNSNDDVEISLDSDSQDWDALLNSYEEYVNKYISYVKKAAKGDMDALTEYPALMNKAQELGDKMKGAKGNMSASQWERYNKITMKMAKAAQEM